MYVFNAPLSRFESNQSQEQAEDRGGQKCWAVVTGATSALGAEYCKQLASKGFNLIMVDRIDPKLQELDTQLHQLFSDIKTVKIVFDITDPTIVNARRHFRSTIGEAISKVESDENLRPTGEEVSMLVVASGQMNHGSFDDLSVAAIKEMIDLNVYMTGFITKMLLNKFYQRAHKGKKSAVIVVSSVLSMRYIPGTVVYSASKAYSTYFTMALGYELLQENFNQSGDFTEDQMVDIQCFSPGPVLADTQYSSPWLNTLKNLFSYEPSKVVDASLRDLLYGHINHSQRTLTMGYWPNDLLRTLLDMVECLSAPVNSFYMHLFSRLK